MVYRAFVAHDQPTAVGHPPEAAFDCPALALTRTRFDGATALWLAPLAALNGRNGRLEAPATPPLAKGMAVIGFVRDQFLRPCTQPAALRRDTHARQGGVRQLALVGLGTGHVHAKRHAMAISHDQHFTALAALRFTDAGAPFFAGTKRPSRRACAQSIWPWACSWLKSARQSCSQVPSATQLRKRRQHVAGELYTRGTSSHVQPVCSTTRMPLRVRRASCRFRPGPGCCFGIKGSRTAHGSSVMSCRLIPPIEREATHFEMASCTTVVIST
jgi:hypothetical protein